MDRGIQPNNNKLPATSLSEAAEMWRAFQTSIAPSQEATITDPLLQELARCATQAHEAEQRGDFTSAVHARREQLDVASRAMPKGAPLLLQAEIQLGRALVKNQDIEQGLEILSESLTAAKHLPADGHELLHHIAMAAHREVLNTHLQRRDFRALLASLSNATEHTAQYRGPASAEIIELAFERVLALEALRAVSEEPNDIQRNQINRAILDARALLLADDCGATAHRRTELLYSLGHKLFSACAWEMASETLLRSLSFVTAPSQRTAMLLMLAQIAAYQARDEEAKQYLNLLDTRVVSKDPASKLLLNQIQLILSPDRPSNIPPGGLPTDHPHLRCIKDYLVRGYVLLTDHQFLAAQGTLEGAGALISHHYHSGHVLWATNHLLLCKVFTERANEMQERGSYDEKSWRGLLRAACAHAMSSYRIHQSLDGPPDARRQALTFALSLSEALGDVAQEMEIRGLLRDE